jgi:hypothetical protein
MGNPAVHPLAIVSRAGPAGDRHQPKSLFLIYASPSPFVWKSYAFTTKYLATGSPFRMSDVVAKNSLPRKKYKQMRNYGLAKSLQREQRSIANIIAETATPTPDITLHSAAALAQVCRGIITGEGPTVAGRVLSSRPMIRHFAQEFLFLPVGPATLSAARRPVRCSTSTMRLAIGWIAGASMTSSPRRSSTMSWQLAGMMYQAAMSRWAPRRS